MVNFHSHAYKKNLIIVVFIILFGTIFFSKLPSNASTINAKPSTASSYQVLLKANPNAGKEKLSEYLLSIGGKVLKEDSDSGILLARFKKKIQPVILSLNSSIDSAEPIKQMVPVNQTLKISNKVKDKVNKKNKANVIITFNDPVSIEAKKELREFAVGHFRAELLKDLSKDKFELKNKFKYTPAVSGMVTQKGIESLENNPLVKSVRLVNHIQIISTESIPLIKADVIHAPPYEITGNGITLAVLDTGVDTDHADFTGDNAIVAQKCFTSDIYNDTGQLVSASDCEGADPYEGNIAEDRNGHGTNVTGIITAPNGVAPDSAIVAIRVANNEGIGSDVDWNNALNWIIDNQDILGVDIINISMEMRNPDGTGLFFDDHTSCNAAFPDLYNTINQLSSMGIIVFAGTGNSGSRSGISAPACLSNVIAVGATYDTSLGREPDEGTYYDPYPGSGHVDQRWADCYDETTDTSMVTCFSNTSTNLANIIMAPGARLTSTGLGGGTSEYSGTSQATPVAAGVGALMLQMNGNLTKNELLSALQGNGTPVFTAQSDEFVLIDVSQAMESITPAECQNISDIPEIECTTLKILYDNNNGANWNNNTEWLQNDTACSWFGITCETGHITGINLPENNLNGTIPDELQNLKQLKAIDLSSNNLTGNIPGAIYNISGMETLQLGQNKLEGTISSEINNLISLVSLDLSQNELNGVIPTGIGNLLALQEINLGGNQLSGNIPGELGNLSVLASLSLHNNQFDGLIPSQLGSLNNLQYLYLQNNQLSGNIPVEISSLVSLIDLDVGYNMLETFDPGLITFLGNKDPDWNQTQTIAPTSFHLSVATDNSVTLAWSAIPYTSDAGYYEISYAASSGGPYMVIDQTTDKFVTSDTIGNLPPDATYYFKVRTFTPAHGDQQNSLLSSYGDELTAGTTGTTFCLGVTEIPEIECRALEALYLSTNSNNWLRNNGWLQNNEPCSWYGINCGGDNSISYISLIGNNLKGYIPLELGNLANLDSGIYLSDNQLSGNIPPVLGNLQNIKYLKLADNKLTGNIPSELGNMQNLLTLDLGSNRFTGSIPPELGNLSNLQNLILSRNFYIDGSIPPELGNLSSLSSLKLDSNKLSGSIPTELGNLNNLQSLDLSGNKISENIPIELGNLGSLQNLNLSGNKISGNIPPELENVTSLQTLYLGMNQLSGNIPSQLGNLLNLTELSLQNNKLSDNIPSQLGNLSNLQILELSDNLLGGEIPSSLCSISGLLPVDFGYQMFEYSDPCIVILDPDWNLTQTVVPTDITTIPRLDGSLDLAWFPIPYQADGGYYQVSYSTQASGPYNNIGCTTIDKTLTGCTTDVLDTDTNYYFVVKTYTPSHYPEQNNDLWSGYSPELAVNIPATLYIEILIPDEGSGIADQNFAIKWKDADINDNASLFLYYDTDNFGEDGTLITGPINVDDIADEYNWDTSVIPAAEYYIYGIVDDGINTPAADYSDGTVTVDHSASTFCQGVTTIPITECKALGALYNSTNGNNWSNNTGWLVNNDPCSWYGLTCTGRNITSIELNFNQLKGNIPPELGNLSNLQELHLLWNQIDGNIPPELGNLSNLLELELWWNQIDGSIPPELGNLSSLQYLDLSENLLSGNIPPALGNLSSLQHLDLSENLLSGNIPSELGNLNNLENLYLYENYLAGSIPPDIGNLISLLNLYLWQNQIDGSIPPELGNLSNLIAFDIDHNQLSGSIPDELGNLSNLAWIDFSFNRLSGNIPAQLGNLSNLQYFYLEYNELIGNIPPELGNLSNLINLNFAENKIEGSIPSTLGDLSSLQNLDLGFNELVADIPPEIGNLSNLETLDLARNKISGSIPSALGNLSSLKNLTLWDNLLSGSIPSQLGNLNNLENITLSDNYLTGSIPPELGNLNNLQSFSLYDNQLSGEIPSSLCSIPGLLISKPHFGHQMFENADSCINDFDSDWEQTQTVPPGNFAFDDDEPINPNHSVNFSWTQILYLSNEGYYQVMYSLQPGGPYDMIACTTYDKITTDCTTGTLNLDTNYYFVVQTYSRSIYNKDLWSPFSSEITLTISDTPKIDIIQPDGFHDISDTSFLIEWTDKDTDYNANISLYYDTDNTGSNGTLIIDAISEDDETDSYLWDTSLIPPGDYYIYGILDDGLNPPVTDYSDGYVTADHTVTSFCAGVFSIPISECEALGALYNFTDGANWTNNSGWLQNIDPCTWHGVNCNFDGVIRLILRSNYLNGIIPGDLDALVNLQILDLRSNYKLVGTIPPELGNLSNLTTLSLYYDNVTGNIPPELASLSNLQYLNLGYNELTGNIPPELGNLSNLQELNLSGNQINGNIPPELGNLSNLTVLYLNTNWLSGNIPPEIGNLNNLQEIYLPWNQIEGNIPSELGNLNNLQNLNIFDNKISGNIPPELGNLSNLQQLNIAGNKLSGVIPSTICGLTLLSTVSFDYNMFEDSDPCIDILVPGWEGTQTIPPANLEVSSTRLDNKVILNWSPISYQEAGGRYEVKYSFTQGGPYDTLACQASNITNTCTTDRLEPNTQYYFVAQTYTPPHEYLFQGYPRDQQNALWSEYSEEVPAIIVQSTGELIETVNNLNSTGEPATIHLYPNFYYSIEQIDNVINGANGLPAITGDITIAGNNTTIEREVIKDNIPDMRVFNVSPGGKLTLKNVKVKNGSLESENGAAIRNEGTLTLENVTLEQNIALSGGAIYNIGQTTIINSTIEYNMAFSGGGGIENTASATLDISNSTLKGNISGSGGGGINNHGSLTIDNTQVNENLAAAGGGLSNGGNTNLTSVEFKTNTTIDPNLTNSPGSGICDHDDPYKGGGICNYGTLTILDSIVQSNASTDLGGGVYNDSTTTGNVSINNSCIVSNAAITNDAITNDSLTSLDATGNWWGYTTVPTPAGIIGGNVDYDSFLTAPILGCPSGMVHDENTSVKKLQALPYVDNEHIDANLQPLGEFTPSCGTGITKGIYYQITDDEELVGNVIGRARIGGIIGRARIGGIIGRVRIGGIIGRARIGGIIGEDKFRFKVSGEDFTPVIAVFVENEQSILEEVSCEEGINNVSQLDVALNPGINHYMVIGFTNTDDGLLEFKSQSLNNPLPVEITDHYLSNVQGAPDEYVLNIDVLNVRDYELNNLAFRLYIEENNNKAAVISDTALISSILQGEIKTINNQLRIQFTGNYTPGDTVKFYLEILEEVTTGSYTRTVVSTIPLIIPQKLKFEYWDFEDEQTITSLPLFPPTGDPRYMGEDLAGLEEYAVRWIEDINFPFNEYYSLTHDKGGELSEQFYDGMTGRLTGYFKAEYAGLYEFYMSVEDGARLIIDGITVIDDTGVRKMEEGSLMGSITLAEGWHEIEIQYFEDLGGNGLKLEYKDPIMSVTEIVPTRLFENPTKSPFENCNLVTDIPAAECQSLSSLYNNTYGDNWTNNTGWLEDGTACDWHGITCLGGHVDKIDLSSNNLSGTIPDNIDNLINLTYLNLAHNNLASVIPVQIGNLNNLDTLYIYANNLSGEILPELINLANLVNLNLADNSLEGTIPAELSNLANLRAFRISNNNFTGNVPVILGSMGNLEILDLSRNQLNGNIPSELGSLSNLTELNLWGNQLSGIIPPELGNLSILQSLDVSMNQLNGTIPATLCNIASLSSPIDFGYNKFSSSDPCLDNLDPDWQGTQTVPPENLSIGTVTINSAEVTWTPIPYQSDGGKYEVLYSQAPGNVCSSGTTGCETADKTFSRCTVDNIDTAQNYYFAVRAYTPAHGEQQNNLVSNCSEEIILNEPPTISIIEPDGSGDLAADNFTITWIDNDDEDNATITLFYDIDSTGQDGTQITECDPILEDDLTDSCTWDTSAIAEGTYYIYAIINDGINPPFSAYSYYPVLVNRQGICPTSLCNGDFEAAPDLEYWTPGNGTNQIVTDIVQDGTNAYFSEHTYGIEENPRWSGIWQTVMVESAQTYGLTGFYLGENAAQGHVKISWKDITGILLQVDYPVTNINGTNSNWIEFSKLIIAPAGAFTAELKVWHGVNTSTQNVLGSKLWMDSMAFEVATTACGTFCNESFEHGILYWIQSGATGSHTIEQTGVHEGLKALRSEQLYTPGDETKWVGITQFAQVKEGTTYRLRAWIKTLNAVNGHIRIRWRDDSGSLINTQYPITGIGGTNPTWFAKEANVTAPPAATRAEIAIWHGVTSANVAGSTLWIDDITMICLSLCNGGFEDGNVHWETNGINEGEIITTNVQEGAQAIKIIQSLNGTYNTQWAGISQRTLVTGDNLYDLSFWIKKENVVQGHVKVKWRDVNDQLISQQFPVGGINGTDLTWAQTETRLTAPVNAETVEILIWHGVDGSNNNATGSTLYIDDVRFTPVPVNNNPINITLSNNSVNENQPAGTSVGIFTTIDPDSGDQHTYDLAAGEGDSGNSNFYLDNNTGELTTKVIFDYETNNSYSIRVRTTDNGTNPPNLTYEEIFTINILDLNDPPTIQILEPDGITDAADTNYTIVWTDYDPEENANISLYFDIDSSGQDGTLIISGLSEDSLTDSYTWDTSAITAGDYFIYGIIDDGVNPQVIDYSDGTISINHSPIIQIVEPDGINDLADTSYTITWTDGDPDNDASISLYYDTDSSSEDGVLITSGLSENDPADSFEWDTSAIPSGGYYIYGVIDDGINPQVVDYSGGTVIVNRVPFIQIVEPDGVNDLANTSYTIAWTDNDTDNDALISLFYDTENSGEDGVLITSGLSENDLADFFEWDTSAISSGNYYIYGVINDGINPQAADYSDGTVTVNSPPILQIVEPDGIDDLADTSYTITWTDDDTDNDASISLFYDTDNSGEDGVLITSGLSENDLADSHVWDTSVIFSGDYYIYGVINDGINPQIVDYSSGTVTVNRVPVIQIIEPDGINDLADTSYTIAWTDNDTDNDALISLFYDTENSGEDGVLITSGLSENDLADFFEWDTSAISSGNYYIYGVINDGINPQAADYSDGTVTVNSPPILQIVEPDGVSDTADTNYTIAWVDEDLDNDASISLFYDSDNTGEDGVLITGGLSENDPTDSYVWDTSAITAGDYYVYGVIDDSVNPQVVDYSDGTVTINRPPTIQIVEPDGASDTTDTSYIITWTDDDQDNDAAISLYYDTDSSGQDGTLIISGLGEDELSDSYTWDTTAIPDGNYYIYGVITDGINPQVVDYSTGVVTILHTAGDDNYEENDTIATAYNIGQDEQTWLSTLNGLGTQSDDDWYQISVTTHYHRLLIDCRFSQSQGNINISLHDSVGTSIASSTSITDNEYIDHTVITGGTYFIRVYFDNAGNTYDLWWDDIPPAEDNYEENDTLATAYNLSQDEQTWLSSVNGMGIQADDDWYQIEVTSGYERILVDCQFNHNNGDINISLYNSSETEITSSTSTSDNEYIDYIVPLAGAYFIKVYFSDTGNMYDLWWSDIDTGPAEDNYEENDTLATAYDLSQDERNWLSTINGLGIQADDDWYKIEVTSGYERVLIDCQFIHSQGDINISLLDSSGTGVISSASTSDDENIDYIVPARGTYYIRVYYGDAGNIYNLWWDDLIPEEDKYEENDTLSTAYDLTQDEQTWLSAVNGMGIQADDDWYQIEVTSGYERVLVNCQFSHNSGDIDISLYNSSENELTSATSTSDNEYIDYIVPAGGIYYIRVYFGDAGNLYDLWWDDISTGLADDNYEENDTRTTAYDLSQNEKIWLSKINGVGFQADDDWYRIVVTNGYERVLIDCQFSHSQGDIDISLYNSSGIYLDSSASTSDDERIDYTVPSGGTYYIRVHFGDAGNIYNLWWDDITP